MIQRERETETGPHDMQLPLVTSHSFAYRRPQILVGLEVVGSDAGYVFSQSPSQWVLLGIKVFQFPWIFGVDFDVFSHVYIHRFFLSFRV